MSNNDKKIWNKTKTYFISQKSKLQSGSFERWKTSSEKGLHYFFSPSSRPHVHRLFTYSVVTLVILFLIPILSTLTQSPPSTPKGQTNVSSILDFPLDTSNQVGEFIQQLNQLKQTDPFKTDHQGSNSSNDQMKICEDAVRKSSLSYFLDSTIVMQNMHKSLAAIQLKGKSKIQAFRVNEKIESQLRIDRIERLRIIVRNLKNGQCEYISNSSFDPKSQIVKLMDKESARNFIESKDKITGIKNDGNNFEINKSFMKSKLSDLSTILTQARAIPLNNPDGSLSFRIEEVEPGGIFASLNINNGDVITRINGQPIASYNEVMTMMNQLQNLSAVNITVLRNGMETPMQYNFVDQ